MRVAHVPLVADLARLCQPCRELAVDIVLMGETDAVDVVAGRDGVDADDRAAQSGMLTATKV